MPADEQALGAELTRYQGLGQGYEQQGLVEIWTDFRSHGQAAAMVASSTDAAMRRALLTAGLGVQYQAAQIMKGFTPYATGQMAESTEAAMVNRGDGVSILITQDRLNTRGTAQVPPLVIGGHQTRGATYVEPNPYNLHALPYIEAAVDAEIYGQSVLLQNTVLEGWTAHASRLERAYPPGAGAL